MVFKVFLKLFIVLYYYEIFIFFVEILQMFTETILRILQDHRQLPVCIFRVKICSFGWKTVTDRIFKIGR
jgi:hypothetical protein